MPKVSVVIPAFGSEAVLADAIVSVRQQSLEQRPEQGSQQRFQDLELLIVDDGSPTDALRSIVERQDQESTFPIRYLYQENQGAAGARNRGLAETSGEYVAFLDADDVFVPGKLALQIALLEAKSSDYALVCGAMRVRPLRAQPSQSRSGDPTEVVRQSVVDGRAYDDLVRDRLTLRGTGAFLYRRSCLEAVGGYDASLRNNEDFDLVLRLARRFSILTHREVVFENREQAHSLSSIDPDSSLAAVLRFLDKLERDDPALPAELLRRKRQRAYFNAANKHLRQRGDFRAFRRTMRTGIQRAGKPSTWRGRVAWAYSATGPLGILGTGLCKRFGAVHAKQGKNALGASSNPTQVRVCQIISSFHPLVGGAEQATLRLCQGLNALGAEVVVLTRRLPGLNSKETVGDIEVRRLGLPLASKWGVPFFVAHVLWTLAIGLRRMRVLHAQGTDAQLISALLASRLPGRRLVLTVHSDPRLRLRITPSNGGLRFRAVRAWADCVGVLGPHMLDTLVQAGVARDRLVLLSNGVDIERFRVPSAPERMRLREKLEVPVDELVVLFVGRLIPLKRVDLLIKALASIDLASRATLVVVGEGPEAGALQALSQRIGLKVRFLGRRDSPEDVLMAADLFVLPSQREGQSMALMEAMACGLVPIVSDLDSNLDLVREGQTGFTFETDNQDSLAQALCLAAGCNRDQIGSQARAEACARFSLEATARTHWSLYEGLSSDQDPKVVVQRAAEDGGGKPASVAIDRE